jgi:hypothetical protein
MWRIISSLVSKLLCRPLAETMAVPFLIDKCELREERSPRRRDYVGFVVRPLTCLMLPPISVQPVNARLVAAQSWSLAKAIRLRWRLMSETCCLWAECAVLSGAKEACAVAETHIRRSSLVRISQA